MVINVVKAVEENVQKGLEEIEADMQKTVSLLSEQAAQYTKTLLHRLIAQTNVRTLHQHQASTVERKSDS